MRNEAFGRRMGGGRMHSGHPRREGFAGERRGGGRRERVFDQGQLRLLILHILEEQPSHGYEIIRGIGERVGGEYSPSPGTVYPTLALLEDMQLAASEPLEGGRRQYRLTDAGRAHLDAHRESLQRLLAHLSMLHRDARARRPPELERAMENVKTALRLRFEDGAPAPELLRRIAAILDQAAVEIGRA
ncbi:MAG: PadR family transcriptional regulator [Pseudoxanthomonas sp.]